jgi:hypothetical protein
LSAAFFAEFYSSFQRASARARDESLRLKFFIATSGSAGASVFIGQLLRCSKFPPVIFGHLTRSRTFCVVATKEAARSVKGPAKLAHGGYRRRTMLNLLLDATV